MKTTRITLSKTEFVEVDGKLYHKELKREVTNRRREMNKEGDKIAAEELYLYINNDWGLYTSQKLMIDKNLSKKYIKGIFKKDLAVKAYLYLANEGAKKYKKEHSALFDVPTRKLVAQMFADSFEADAKIGNFTE